MSHKPNVVDGPIDNEFALIKAVLDHRDHLEGNNMWGMTRDEVLDCIHKYMAEINKRPMFNTMPIQPVDPYWMRQQVMIPITGRRESIFIIDDGI